jgi:hypothetical protein
MSEIHDKDTMAPSIVAVAPRLCVSAAQQGRAFLALASTLAMLACGSSPQSGVTPSPLPASSAGSATPTTFSVTGIVRGASGPLSDASVDLEGPGRYSTRTDAQGAYRFSQVQRGEYVLRASSPGHANAEWPLTIEADTTRDVPLQPASSPPSTPAPFPPPPYTFSGTVRDSRRNPVGGAEIWLYSNSSPIDDRRGSGVADSSGRYTITLQRTAQTVRAMKDGYVTNDVSILGTSSSGTTFVTDVTIRKIDRYTLLSPTSLKVGDVVRMEGRVELDDGSSVTGGCVCFQLTSSHPSIVAVDGTGNSGFIRGVAPGTATITGTYFGVTTTLVVRVNP